MNRLSRTLFRSFLRWTRRPEVSATSFNIYPKELGVDHLLPANVLIKDAEGVQGTVYHCFRHGNKDHIDLGFTVLKHLNEYHVKLKEELEQRLIHRNPMFTQYATYKVGEVVQMKATGVRAVVVGWEVDAARGKQKLDIIMDTTDYNEFTVRPRKNRLIPSEDVTRVTESQLKRINNAQVNTFFYFYDEQSQRYVPRDELYQLYSADFEGVTFGKVLDGQDDKKTLQNVTQGIATLGQHLQVILEDSFPTILLPNEHKQVTQKNDDEMNERIVSKQILDEIIQHVQNLITPHPSMKSSSSSSSSSRQSENTSSVSVKLLRGGAYRQGAVEKKKEIPPFYFTEKDQIAIESAYGSVFNLQELLTALHQLLQLRFQTRGLTFVDRLRVENTDDGSVKIVALPLSPETESLDKETRFPIPIFEMGQIVRHKKFPYRGVISGYDQRPLLDVSKWEGVQGLALGREQPFYRVIPDQRDVEQFLGPGVYRQYYYTAQENLELIHDPASMIVNHKNLDKFFLGWDMETSRFRVPHKLKYCFPCAHHKIPENYPTTSILSHWKDHQQPSSPSIDSQEEKTIEQLKEEVKETEIKIYEKIDFVLLELYAQIVTMLCETRVHHISENSSINYVQASTSNENHLHITVADLLLLLRKSPTREAAMGIESLLWFVWTTHRDPDVATALRLGISYMKRGNQDKAIEAYQVAAKFDPNFAEIHNKLAAIYHAKGKHQECLDAATLALKQFPDHYGALAGMSLSYEKLGQKEEAKSHIREVLKIHPWAANLPTILQSILIAEQNAQEEASNNSTNKDEFGVERIEPVVNPPNSN